MLQLIASCTPGSGTRLLQFMYYNSFEGEPPKLESQTVIEVDENYKYSLTWKVGRACAVDKMTVRFKGKHKDTKDEITYKAEGDGFQSDTLCNDEYCYQMYIRNDKGPKKHLKKGLSPLHYQTIALVDSLKNDYDAFQF